jgi:hypothetical protein
VAADALDAASGIGDLETVIVDEVIEEHGDEDEPEAEEPEAEPEPESEVEVELDAAPEPSVEDEVAEILIEAGVDEPADAGDEAKD